MQRRGLIVVAIFGLIALAILSGRRGSREASAPGAAPVAAEVSTDAASVASGGGSSLQAASGDPGSVVSTENRPAQRTRAPVRSPLPEKKGAIAGLVLDPDGRPCVQSTVRARLETATEPLAVTAVAADGSYRILLDEGAYTIEARAPGLRSEPQPGIAVRVGEETRGIDFILDRGERILGLVLGPDDRPLDGASVLARPAYVPHARPATEPEAVTKTAKDGTFELAGLTAGKKTLLAKMQGLCPSEPAQVLVKPHEAARVELKLKKGTFIAGRVTLVSGGAPAPGVRVEVKPSAGGMGFMMGRPPGAIADLTVEATTGEDGRYRAEGLSGRRFEATAIPAAQGLAPATRSWIQAGEEHADLALGAPASLAGVVVASGSGDALDATVVVHGPTETSAGASSGRFEFQGLSAPGEYTIVAQAQGRAERSLRLSLAAGERKEGVRLELAKGSAIEGVVLAAKGGKPIANAVVRAIAIEVDENGKPKGRGGPREEMMVELVAGGADLAPFIPPERLAQVMGANATTDGSGRFSIGSLAVGTYRVYAAAAAYPGAGVPAKIETPGATVDVEIQLSQGGGIAGRVTDDGGAPKGGAPVFAFSPMGRARTTTTDDQGRYTISGLAAGSYFASTGMPGFGGGGGGGGGFSPKTANVEADKVVELDFGPEPKVAVTGHVLRAGAPVADQNVTFFASGGSATVMTAGVTDAQGAYEVSLVPGTYLVKTENLSENLTLTLDAPRVSHDIALPSGSLSGRVLSSAGGALPGARVDLYRPGAGGDQSLVGTLGAEAGQARASADGTFRMSGLAPGTYVITAGADGYVTARADGIVVAADAEKADVALTCDPGGVIRGTVLDDKGQPLSGSWVSIVAASQTDIPGNQPPRTGDDGSFEIRRFAPGRYRIEVISESLAPWRQFVDFPGGTLELPPIQLAAGGTLDLTVVDATGRPVPGALVELRYPEGDRVLTGFVDFMNPATPAGQDGRLRKPRLPAGAIMGLAHTDAPGKPRMQGSFQLVMENGAEVPSVARIQ